MKTALPLLLALPLLPVACVIRIGGADGERASTYVGPDLEGRARREITAPLELSKGEALHMGTDFGDVEVASSSEAEPSVTVTLSLRADTDEQARAAIETYRVETRRGDDGTAVEVVGEPVRIEVDGTEIEQTATYAFRAVVPPGTPLVLETSSGDITARGSLGHVRVRSSFGDVTLEGATGADVSASSGDVEVTGLHGVTAFRGGGCRVWSSFGDVSVTGVLTTVDARASSGDVTVTALHGSRVNAPWVLLSSFGDVELTMPPGLAFRVEAKTSFGSIETDLPGRRTETTTGGSFAGTCGRGGGLVTLSTSSGDVTLELR